MAIKLFDSELKVMSVLWREGDTAIALNEMKKVFDLNGVETEVVRFPAEGALIQGHPAALADKLSR